MSKSINELFRMIAKGNPIPESETELSNPSIPEMDDTLNIEDSYHKNLKFPSRPFNGMAALPLPRRIPQDPFLLNGSIDPNIIRSMTDPDSAHPSLASQSLFSFERESVVKPHNNESLIKKSHASELNWKNRYTPPTRS